MILVISPSAFNKIDEIIKKFNSDKIIITTYGVSYALSNNINIDKILDLGIKVMAYSHKPYQVSNLSITESEAILVARDLKATLIASDTKIKEEAEKLGISVILI
ncbi:hypothetical protein [Acidianus brierleyi]|uniref:PIN domain-containing protein n=1 Tax=Acidianus brierleyi TaxID=41673 RepID=A0A2U9IGH4_9CREN|nr:hypothetical protein [Acidianus brierleyi]AWR95110.1 hypothetical protein DFR85_11390 [Acidianus brierleyi]